MNWNKYDYTVTSPCQGCTKRHSGCHSSCKDYKDFRAELDRESEQRHKSTGKEVAYRDYKINGMSKELKRRGRRK